VRTQRVRFWCQEFESCRIDMLTGQCVKEGCEGSMCEETNFGKRTNHNSRLIYCRAVANSKWKWPILISGGMQQSDFYCSKVSILVLEGVHTECDSRLSWNVMVLQWKNEQRLTLYLIVVPRQAVIE